MSKGRWIRRSRKGAIELRLTDPERQLLVSLASALRTSLDGGDVRGNPALTRLFPPAYADAEEGEAEADYQSLVHADLLASRRAHLDVLKATAGEERLDEEQLLAWMGSLNDLRLVLGTRLDVSEDMTGPDPGHPEAALLEIYHYLGFLLEEVLVALDPYAGGTAVEG